MGTNEDAWKALAVGALLLCLLTAGLFSVAKASSDIMIQPQEIETGRCRAAHDRLEHDAVGQIKGITTYYVCPDKVKRIYREVK